MYVLCISLKPAGVSTRGPGRGPSAGGRGRVWGPGVDADIDKNPCARKVSLCELTNVSLLEEWIYLECLHMLGVFQQNSYSHLYNYELKRLIIFNKVKVSCRSTVVVPE